MYVGSPPAPLNATVSSDDLFRLSQQRVVGLHPIVFTCLVCAVMFGMCFMLSVVRRQFFGWHHRRLVEASRRALLLAAVTAAAQDALARVQAGGGSDGAQCLGAPLLAMPWPPVRGTPAPTLRAAVRVVDAPGGVAGDIALQTWHRRGGEPPRGEPARGHVPGGRPDASFHAARAGPASGARTARPRQPHLRGWGLRRRCRRAAQRCPASARRAVVVASRLAPWPCCCVGRAALACTRRWRLELSAVGCRLSAARATALLPLAPGGLVVAGEGAGGCSTHAPPPPDLRTGLRARGRRARTAGTHNLH
jgi:hypothetical protein